MSKGQYSDLGNKMAKGAAWLLLLRLCDRVIGVASTLVLARLLVPADFGLVAMATSILATLELFSAFSFDLALIQNQHAERRHYDAAWSLTVAFGAFNALCLCLLAIPAAKFYGDPRVEPLMYVLAVSPFVHGFENIGIVAFQKELKLHKEFWFRFTRKVVGFALTLILAFQFRNYWALVGGTLVASTLGMVLSYVVHPYRPRLTFEGAGELMHFSKWLLLNNLLIFANNRGTDFLIGHLNGARALGLYSVSYEISNLPTTEMVWPIQRAVFPGYARLAGSRDELRHAFLQVLSLVALMAVPAGAGVGLAAEPIVRLLLGSQWLETIPLIQILATFGIVRSLHGPTGSVFLAIGRPRLVAVVQLVQIVCAVALMAFFIPRLGARGAAWSILIAACFAASVNFSMVCRELSMSFVQVMAAVWRPLISAAVMALVLTSLASPIAEDAGVLAVAARLAFVVATGVACYVCGVALLWWAAGRPAGAELHVVKYVLKRVPQRSPVRERGAQARSEDTSAARMTHEAGERMP